MSTKPNNRPTLVVPTRINVIAVIFFIGMVVPAVIAVIVTATGESAKDAWNLSAMCAVGFLSTMYASGTVLNSNVKSVNDHFDAQQPPPERPVDQ